MRSVAALLAAVLAAGLAGCGDGAEPGASREATLVLDFQPNAVHAGIYSALRHDDYGERGVRLEVRQPSEATDAPRLLEAGRAELAILTISDLGIALERGLDLRPVAQLVTRPLGSVIAADRRRVRRPRDLEGATVGVTGLPSDDAVLDAVLAGDGGDPASVERIPIGFDAVAALAAGRLDAATGFWSSEGVTLRRLGVPVRELRIDDWGARPYPELLVVAAEGTVAEDPELIESVVAATEAGYERVERDPEAAIGDLLAEAPGLDAAEQRAQLDALLDAGALAPPIEPARRRLRNWLRFADGRGVVDAGAVAGPMLR